MGINIPTNSGLGSISYQFFSFFFLPLFFFLLSMNLTVLAGILLAVTLATARRVNLDGKTMQAAGEPQEAMRGAARPASLVEKMMNKRMKQLEVREAAGVLGCTGLFKPCKKGDKCCNGTSCQKQQPRNGKLHC